MKTRVYINSRGKPTIQAPYSDIGVEVSLEQAIFKHWLYVVH